MASGDLYRIRAAELRGKSQQEADPQIQAELEGLAAAYLRLAEQAERNSTADLVYEPPPLKADDPDFKY